MWYPPLAIDGPIMSIRRFGRTPIGVDQLLSKHAITSPMLELLKSAVKARLNIIVSGGTGAGKTTLLNALSILSPSGSESLRSRTRPNCKCSSRTSSNGMPSSNVEGKGAVRQRELVINALRMRPDRIVLGEVRGGEALDMLQA